MRVRLTRRMLRGACRPGIRRFEQVFPDGIDAEWTPAHSLWAATHFKFYGYLVDNLLLPICDLSGQDLRNVELDKLRVGKASSDRADFTGAIVSPWQRMPEGWEVHQGRMRRCT